MADQFSTNADQVSAPATKALAVSPHDTNPLTDIPTALFVGSALVWIVGEVVHGLYRRRNADNTDRNSLLILRACVVAGALLATFAERVPAAALPEEPAIFGMSLVLLWFGVGLRWWCFRTLGQYFTITVMTSADQPVISGGPYRALRHPSYAGLLVALVGVGLSLGNWLSLGALVVSAVIGILYRIHVEEVALSSALGPRYTAYAIGRKRLIPFVW